MTAVGAKEKLTTTESAGNLKPKAREKQLPDPAGSENQMRRLSRVLDWAFFFSYVLIGFLLFMALIVAKRN